ncbi:VIR protein [Plasmodium vivax]|uniref:VIR protein n=1 Tax=Plasmodium vivax TaxID=5855 RepID=A0A1G4HDN3_PLAVI|nr:VIR protein [Plasmodium vivax]
MYNDFDKRVGNDIYRYQPFCNPLLKQYDENNEEHRNFCLKLIRNLGHYSEDFKFQRFNSVYCTNLNYWVYNSMKKFKIPNEMITQCYNDYNRVMRETRNTPICSYSSYDDIYEEPLNIIILNILESNMNIIQNALDGTHASISLPLQMYICEFIKIYKDMYIKYCNNQNDDDEKRLFTCSRLSAIKSTYDIFLSRESYAKYKIPSLDKDEEKYLAMCKPDKPRLALTAKLDEKIPVLGPTTQDEDRYSGAIPHLSPVTNENKGSSMPRTVSTAFGTVAGASSVLALLYKFTPGGKWIRSGIRGGRGRISNNLYRDAPNELLFNGIQGEDMSSYNERYNIGYGSV